jgi:glycine cleavage system H protein
MTNPDVPEDRLYSADHEWVALLSAAEIPTEPVRVGISRLAADSLGDIVFLELPQVGFEVTAGQTCGEVESTKAVSDLVAPITGTVTDVNEAAVADPALVSTDPYGAGWLFAVETSALGHLMTANEYAQENGLNP